jgi:hypothetical protein
MFVRIAGCSILSVLLLALAIGLVPPTALADGGAPNLAYVAGTGKGVSVIDVAQQKVVSTIAINGDPHELALSLDGRFLYVAQPLAGRVAFIAAKTGDTYCTANVPGQPTLLSLDPTTNTLFAAGNEASSVTVLDPDNCAIKHTLQTPGPVYGLGVATTTTSGVSSDQIWVSTSDAVHIFDTTSWKQVKSVPIPGGPRYITIPPGSAGYVVTNQGSVVSVDLSNYSVNTLISGGEYGPMDFNEGTGEVYVPDQKNNQVVVLAPVNTGAPLPKEPSRVVKLGARPISVAITSDGQLGFVALEGGNVAMLNIPEHEQIMTTINVGGNPRFIITGLYPPAFGTTPQQASVLSIIVNIAGYAIVVILLIVPFVLFRRYSRVHRAKDTFKK